MRQVGSHLWAMGRFFEWHCVHFQQSVQKCLSFETYKVIPVPLNVLFAVDALNCMMIGIGHFRYNKCIFCTLFQLCCMHGNTVLNLSSYLQILVHVPTSVEITRTSTDDNNKPSSCNVSTSSGCRFFCTEKLCDTPTKVAYRTC